MAAKTHIARYFLEQSRQRWQEYGEHRNEPRLADSARALLNLAKYVNELADDDECCREIMQCSMALDRFAPEDKGHVSRAIGAFGFGSTHPDCAAFVRTLPKLLAIDLVDFAMDIGAFDA